MDDRIIIQVPYVDEEGTVRIALHNLFCGVEGCHSIGFELRNDSYWCKKCKTLTSYRLRPEEENAVLMDGFLGEHVTKH